MTHLCLTGAGPSSGGSLYVLRDDFTTDDDAPVTSPRTCEPKGTLTFVQTDGTFAISSAKLAFAAQTTPVWGDQGFYGAGITRAAGTVIGCALNVGTWEECGFGLHTAAAVVDPDSTEHAVQLNATDGQLDLDDDVQIDQGLSTATDYGIYFVLRASGCHILKKVGTAYTLLWVESGQTTATLYPMFSNLDGAGTIDHLFVTKAAKWSPTPIASDSFNRADSSTLGNTDGSGAEESGGSGLAWSEWVEPASGALDCLIASNKLSIPADTTHYGGSVADTGSANVVMMADGTVAAGCYAALVLRFVDNRNLWLISDTTLSNKWEIYQVVNGTWTSRASATLTATGARKFLVIADGQTITAYLDGANRISYASASAHLTATKCGAYCFGGAFTVDNFVVWARAQTLPSF